MAEMSDPTRPRLAQGLIIAASLAGFLAAGIALDRAPYFANARTMLRGQAGPAAMPDDGEVGRATARIIERFGPPAIFSGSIETLPSSVVLTPRQRRGRFPIVSIAADPDHLDDPVHGIMANMRETGPEWERLASVSLWEDGQLTAGSRVGLRIHGDSTRFREDPSFRLHFRPFYGATAATGGRFLGPDAAPAAAVVVHVVRWRGHYPNIFVFEMARTLDLPTVDFRPARIFLNGEPRGIYVLTERVMPDGWGRTYFGDSDFFMQVYKGETKRPSRQAHDELVSWVASSSPITMRRAAERIDVDNLTGHLFAVMFAFTTDWAQGAALLDRDDPEARWFWLHWDMDQSFDLRGIVDVEPWQQPFMELITLEGTRDDLEAYGIVTDDRHDARHRGDIRRLLFIDLLQDPEYRDYFVRYATDTLNHRLTPTYLRDLLTRYRDLESAPGVYSRVDLGEYFRRRPDFVRAELARYFGLETPVAVNIEAPPGTRLVVDGFALEGAYAGMYFPGQRITIELTAPDGRFSHWLVDGERRARRDLELVATTGHVIEPVFADAAGR